MDIASALEERIDDDRTWAEVLDLTRLEAYGMAQTAGRYLETGQLDRARAILEGLVVCNPHDAYFEALLGAICGRQGEEALAFEHYSRAIVLDEENLPARVNRADMLLRQGKLEAALIDLTAAVRADPRGLQPLGRRALALARATVDGVRALSNPA